MVDGRGMYAQHIDVARMALIRGDRPAAAESFRAATDVARGEPELQRELTAALVHLGKVEQELGRPAEAERLFNEALEIGEQLFGADHPSLGVALNELSRLHIRQSNHARAKAVLERLLRITRTKGEDHPDVATALAGLAVVQRGLGDDATAERLFRDALRIREKVLAPNHMAIVVTLEQLAETCAARGNPAGAVALLQRALPTREAALGADHATVRAMRARIAAFGKAQPIAPISAPPVRPTDLVFLYKPEPAAPRPAPPPRERMATPTYSAAVAAASLIASPIQVPRPARPAPSAQTTAPASPAPSAPPASFAKIVAPRRRHDVAPHPVAHDDRPHTIAPLPAPSNRRSSGRRTALSSFAILATVGLAITGLTLRGSIGAAGDDFAARPDVAPRPAPVAAAAVTTSGSTTLGAATVVAAARPDSVPSATETLQPTADVVQAGVPAPENAVAPAKDSPVAPAPPSLPAAPRRMAAVKVPIITTNVDSLVRASTFTDQSGITGGLRTHRSAMTRARSLPCSSGRRRFPTSPTRCARSGPRERSSSGSVSTSVVASTCRASRW